MDPVIHSASVTAWARNLDLVGGVLVLLVDLQHHHPLVNLVDKLLLAKITSAELNTAIPELFHLWSCSLEVA